LRIVHITDLHLSSPLYVPEWGKAMVEYVNGSDLDLLIITGDLTMEGHLFEYELARDFIEGFDVRNMLMVPGNHDSRNDGHTLFEEMFGDRFPSFENDETVVLGLDSSGPDSNDGHIGRENYPLIHTRFNGSDKIKFIVLHHHLIPIPGTGRERNIPQDAGDLLRIMVGSGTHFVLSGHKHKPWVWKLNDTYFITAGTACTKRLKGRSYPSFNIYSIQGKSLTVEEFRVDNGTTRELLKVDMTQPSP